MVTLGHFVDNYVTPTSSSLTETQTDGDSPVTEQDTGHTRGYLAQHPLFDQIPELRRDIATPDYCCLGQEDDVQVRQPLLPL